MDLFSSFFAAILFSLACNLDTLMLSMGYALRGVAVSARGALVIAAVTTAVTWLSLALGDLAARFLTPELTRLLGALVLLGIGIWLLLPALRRNGESGGEDGPARPAGMWSYFSLAAALAANNAGIGAAAGVSGVSPAWAAGCNFLITLLFLPMGHRLGRAAGDRPWGKLALLLSGLLLVALGLWEALF